jgi:hypothetical protein
MTSTFRALLCALPLACAAACGASSTGSSDQPKPIETWQTELEWRLTSSERCFTGPFEIEVPDREIEFGRRFAVEVYGPRALPMDSQFAYTNGWTSSGWGWSEEGLGESLGDHSACRAHADEAEVTSETSVASADLSERTGAKESPRGKRTATAPPAEKAPEPEPVNVTLETFEGPLPNVRSQRGGIAWFPHGAPTFTSIDDINVPFYSEGGNAGFRFRFWFHRPVDMSGVVIRIRDQVLVPTIAMERYRESFPERVAEVERRIREAEVVSGDEPRSAARGKIPPAPKRETVPAAPGPNVEWIPGYWRYHESLEDFVWIAGTFVVRAPPAPPAATEPAAVTTAKVEEPVVVAEAPAVEEDRVAAEAVVTLDERVPPQPEPRREVIPPPPAIAGAQWIPGYWELRGKAWAWVDGRWQVPRQGTARFRPPSIEVRGHVKVYVPGGWTLRAR